MYGVYTYVHMETLVLDGKEYVKASKAAKDLGYTSDHVGQLCRSGKVSAHLVGRTWYVRKDELSDHKIEKKRNSRTKAREQAKKTIELHRNKETSKSRSDEITIKYESDLAELIPETRKLQISSEPVDIKYQDFNEEEVSNERFIVENKGEKITLSGDLKVIDATDGPVDTETTFLRPKIVKTPKTSRKAVKKVPNIDVETEEEPSDTSTSIAVSSFEDKLGIVDSAENIDISGTEESKEVSDAYVEEGSPVATKESYLPYVLTTLLVLVISAWSTTLSYNIIYTAENPESPVTNIQMSVQETIEIIRSKI